MDLILWRSAEADEHAEDMERRLTAKGRRHCERVAAWLDQRLPARFTILASPAVRAQQTAQALGIPVKRESGLAPGSTPAAILKAAGWRDCKSTVVVVGHQPDLGNVLAELLSSSFARWTIKKGGLWWLTNRVRGEERQVVVRAVVSPELL
jgi:phosphohistidine phosphatase